MPHNCLQVKPSDVSDESEIETDNLKLKEFHSPLHNIEVDAVLAKFSKHIILLPQSDHVRVLQTVIRNRYNFSVKETPRNEFLFNADCLIRLVVEEGLNQLPYENVCVTTPTGKCTRHMHI
ncbi:Uracil phosphoribosyltransferase like [Schistosoma japonicum]|nr:Uracil phosphoribosyltransferase like [Schistosoma japonicum]